MIGLVILTGCNSGSGTPRAPASPKPSATRPGGAVASILCRTHRVEIQSNEQALTVDEAGGDTTAASALRVKIRADLAAARAIPGCNVDDLPLH